MYVALFMKYNKMFLESLLLCPNLPHPFHIQRVGSESDVIIAFSVYLMMTIEVDIHVHVGTTARPLHALDSYSRSIDRLQVEFTLSVSSVS